MIRIPYEFIEDFAFELIRLAAISDEASYSHYMELYSQYLRECGWTDLEFDQEVLQRVDASWNTELDVTIKYWH